MLSLIQKLTPEARRLLVLVINAPMITDKQALSIIQKLTPEARRLLVLVINAPMITDEQAAFILDIPEISSIDQFRNEIIKGGLNWDEAGKLLNSLVNA